MNWERLFSIRVENLRAIALNIPCDRCKAGPGESCRKPNGEPLWKKGLPTRVHVQRITPVWVIYKIGYQHGRRDAKSEQREEAENDASTSEV